MTAASHLRVRRRRRVVEGHVPPARMAGARPRSPVDTIEEFPIVTPSGVADTFSALLCEVCQRARPRLQPDRFGRVLACETCLHVDATFGGLHGARLLTPLDRDRVREEDALHHRLFGHDDSLTARHQHFHAVQLRAMNDEATAGGVRHLVVTYPHGGFRALFVDWDRWRLHFPASLGASVEGYLRYVRKVHPWALEVEPRLLRPQWLSGLLDGTDTRA